MQRINGIALSVSSRNYPLVIGMACHFTQLCGHTSTPTPTQQHFKWQSPKTAINMMRLAFEWHVVKADTNINRTHTWHRLSFKWQYLSIVGNGSKNTIAWGISRELQHIGEKRMHRRKRITFEMQNEYSAPPMHFYGLFVRFSVGHSYAIGRWQCSAFALWLIATSKSIQQQNANRRSQWLKPCRRSSSSVWKKCSLRNLICRSHCNRFILPMDSPPFDARNVKFSTIKRFSPFIVRLLVANRPN